MKKLFIFLFLTAITFVAVGQAAVVDFKNSTYTTLLSDTVTNAATGTISTTAVTSGNQSATIQVVATKISGTVAGTITLQGSIDGSNWVALTDSTSEPNVTTKTATDVASQSFLWRLDANPCRYYRISWTGTGTMSASFSGKLMTR